MSVSPSSSESLRAGGGPGGGPGGFRCFTSLQVNVQYQHIRIISVTIAAITKVYRKQSQDPSYIMFVTLQVKLLMPFYSHILFLWSFNQEP